VATRTFLLQLALSFLVGGGWIAATTALAERLGSKVGGLLVTLPSTILVGLFFVGVTQGSGAVVRLTTALPANVTTSVMLLVAFAAAYRYGRLAAYAAGYSAWLLLGLTWVLLQIPSIWLALAPALLMLITGVAFFRRRPHMRLARVSFSVRAMLLRYLLAGSVVTAAVLCSHLLGPFWGALFASFPAAFTGTLMVLEPAHGIDFTAAVARTMCQGLGVNLVFLIVIYLATPATGFIAGIGLAYIASIASAAAIHRVTVRQA
jgi:hypothetical protein